jgi:pimeloyl-ACP methyl ester carboxylesterase
MKPTNSKIYTALLTVILLAAVLMAISWWGVIRLGEGLTIRKFRREGQPFSYIGPREGQNVPGVIAAHGFGGSQQLMLGYGYTLARSGYGVVLLDFKGHGANSNPMESARDGLQEDLDAATQLLIQQPEVNPEQIALLGHSMGSGAVMQAGIENPDRYDAVIAISPTGAEVSDSVPPNLLLMAGEWEGRFVTNAQQLLEKAGGASTEFRSKLARQFVEISNAEHISILFNTSSQKQSVTWLNRTFEIEKESTIRDRRILWYGLHLGAWVILSVASKSLIGSQGDHTHDQTLSRRTWLYLIMAPFIATALLALLNALVDVTSILNIMVGGALGLWFLLMGVTWLVGGVRPEAPTLRSLIQGLLLFATLWLALGMMAQFTWMNWFLIPDRLWRWLILASACLPWKLAAGTAHHQATKYGKLGIWALQSTAIVSTLVLTAFLVPGMFVVILIAPVLPLIIGIETLIGVQYHAPWTYGIGSAMFFGWMMAAFFPIV